MSKESRLAAKKRSKQAKMKRLRNKILLCIGILLIPVIIALITLKVIDNNIKDKQSANRYIKADGTIDAKAAKNYVKVADYKNISVNREDYLPTESELASSVETVMKGYTETVTTDGTAITSTSTVNLTYTVTVDGSELSDYAQTNGAYALGSGTRFGTEFDEKIAALKVGDSINFDITFADDYSNTTFAGKTATFKGKVDSVDVVPELTDSFVAEKLTDYMGDSEYPKTAEGLKSYVANNLYENKLRTYISSWIPENTEKSALFYPYFYYKNKYYYIDNYYDQLESQYKSYGLDMDKYDIMGASSKGDYKKKLKKLAKSEVKRDLAYQAIYEDAGLEAITDEVLAAHATEEGYSDVDSFISAYGGKGAAAQSVLKEKVLEYVFSIVKVEGDSSQMWKDDPATADTAEAE
ncbi:MAG: hypothetical protein IKR27_01560 [Lachnospiraceae bacterium]|nr:hypothetical protein [Lachnospiraceae bacterium]